MSIDPAAPSPLTTEARQAAKIAELERRLMRLENNNAVPVTDTVPSGTAAREGALILYAAGGTYRLYGYLGGAWRNVALT